jgi:hypothetical protein
MVPLFIFSSVKNNILYKEHYTNNFIKTVSSFPGFCQEKFYLQPIVPKTCFYTGSLRAVLIPAPIKAE